MGKKFIRVSLMFRLVEMAECHEPLGQSAFHLSGRRTQFVGRAAGLVALHARNCAAVWGGPAQDPSLSKSWLAGDFRRELLELRMTVCSGDLVGLGLEKLQASRQWLDRGATACTRMRCLISLSSCQCNVYGVGMYELQVRSWPSP